MAHTIPIAVIKLNASVGWKVHQRIDAVVERRVRRKERSVLAAYAKCLERVGENTRLEIPEAAERGDHRGWRADETRGPGVRGKFAAAAVPHDNNRRKEPERKLHDHHNYVIKPVSSPAPTALLAVERTLDYLSGNMREEDDERVHDALRDAHSHHVAVCDVRDLVAKDATKFLARHLAHDVGRDGDERGVLERAGGERVCRTRVYRDLGRLDVRESGLVLDV